MKVDLRDMHSHVLISYRWNLVLGVQYTPPQTRLKLPGMFVLLRQSLDPVGIPYVGKYNFSGLHTLSEAITVIVAKHWDL